MKKVIFLFISLGLFVGFSKEQAIKQATISFEELIHDFGDITQGDVVKHVFKFKNTGDDTLRLSNVLSTCGCTIPEWTKKPIPPGGSGEILASFNSAGKMGLQNKVITVMSNASNAQATFTIKANVLAAPGDGMRATQK